MEEQVAEEIFRWIRTAEEAEEILHKEGIEWDTISKGEMGGRAYMVDDRAVAVWMKMDRELIVYPPPPKVNPEEHLTNLRKMVSDMGEQAEVLQTHAAQDVPDYQFIISLLNFMKQFIEEAEQSATILKDHQS